MAGGGCGDSGLGRRNGQRHRRSLMPTAARTPAIAGSRTARTPTRRTAGRPAKHSTQSSATSGSAARKAQKSSASDTAEAADVTAPAATAVSGTGEQVPLVPSKAAVRRRRDRRHSARRAGYLGRARRRRRFPILTRASSFPRTSLRARTCSSRSTDSTTAKTALNQKHVGTDQHPRRSGGDRAATCCCPRPRSSCRRGRR